MEIEQEKLPSRNIITTSQTSYKQIKNIAKITNKGND